MSTSISSAIWQRAGSCCRLQRQPKHALLSSTTLQRRRACIVRADLTSEMAAEAQQTVPVPEGVTPPRKIPEINPPTFGFVEKAERWNSRACMIGFFALLVVELLAKRGLLELLGFKVGQGLPFEI